MKELNRIKKIYGEEMMRLCRELFPRILEKEGLLLSILERNLAPTHSFASDIREKELEEEFKNWIYSFINVEEEKEKTTNKSPFELMDEAGYTLYECKNEEDIQGFRKYYKEDEVLCTIYNGGRLNRCHVFFAVKRNVDKIKREDFTKPRREDEYGTSVISIQFSRGSNTLSIKNRYNHTVNNPDATFSNNLENITPGLTDSFEKYMGFKINQQTRRESDFLTRSLPYTRGNDGKYYRYNLEIDGVYYCENNIIIEHGRVILAYAQSKERYILIDQFLIDRKEKRIVRLSRDKESFTESIYSIGEIKSIDSIKDGKNKTIIINYIDGKQVKIEIDKNNAIIGYENDFVTEIGNDFLYRSNQLSSISLPNVREIGSGFLYYNECLRSIILPSVEIIGSDFLYYNRQLSSITLPNVRKIGDWFLLWNECLRSISLPNTEIIGNWFLYSNHSLSSIFLPNVRKIGHGFLLYNPHLDSIKLEIERTRNEKSNNKRNK